MLYEEQLNQASVNSAVDYIENADMLIVGGTSLEVNTARCIEYFFLRPQNKKSVIINKSETDYDRMFDIFIGEGIGSVLKQAYEKLYGELN